MKTKLLLTLTSLGCMTAGVHAANIFSDSFDYGGSDITLNNANATGWGTSSSTLLIYDADAGINDARVNGETGGALGTPGSATGQSAGTSLTYAMSSLGAGDTLWMSSLVQYVSGSNDYRVNFTGDSVTGLGFNITGAGLLELYGSDNGGTTADHGTSTTGISSGTYLVVLRATKGTGAGGNDPSNSIIDLWFNPADTTSAATLGSAAFTTGADSKFGRNSQSLTGVSVNMGSGGAIDEIRLGAEFSDLNLVPEPSSFALLSGMLALGWIMLRRR